MSSNQRGLLGMFNVFAGGAIARMALLALGIMPYISSSIIVQLLTGVSDYFKNLKNQGEIGRKKITQITRYGTVLLATIQGYGLSVGLESAENLVINPGMFFRISTVITIVASTMFLMWLGEQITQRGIGNGISLIIFSGIVAEIPRALAATFELGRTGALSASIILMIFVLVISTVAFIVFIERAIRKILINYPKRQMGTKIYGGESSHLPLRINTAGVIPAIFASALLLLPVTFSNFGMTDSELFAGLSSLFSQGRRSPTSEETTTNSDLPVIRTKFTTIAPQLSLNFSGTSGWSYISGGLGTSTFDVGPPEAERDDRRFRTINYGGGGRWFAKDHLGFSLDLRFYGISPQGGTDKLPALPRMRLVVLSIGVSFK